MGNVLPWDVAPTSWLGVSVTRCAAPALICSQVYHLTSSGPGIGLQMARQQMSKLFDLLLEKHLSRHWKILDTLQRD